MPHTNASQLKFMPEFKALKTEKTMLENVQLLDGHTIKIEFTHPAESEDTKIYRVSTFQHWVNLTTDPRIVVYDGPRYLMHNTTANCTKGIPEPDGDAIYETRI